MEIQTIIFSIFVLTNTGIFIIGYKYSRICCKEVS